MLLIYNILVCTVSPHLANPTQNSNINCNIKKGWMDAWSVDSIASKSLLLDITSLSSTIEDIIH